MFYLTPWYLVHDVVKKTFMIHGDRNQESLLVTKSKERKTHNLDRGAGTSEKWGTEFSNIRMFLVENLSWGFGLNLP
jgi:hypothetical protein